MEQKPKIPDTRLKLWRKFREVKPAELMKAAKISSSAYYKYERGVQGLSATLLEKWSRILNVRPDQLMEKSPPPGFSDEGHSYTAPDSHYLAPTSDEVGLDLWEITDSALDLAGLDKGDIVLVDSRAGFLDTLKSGKIVIAQVYYDDPDHPLGKNAKTIFRQFLKPSLLTSNSKQKNQLPLLVDNDQVVIMGVVRSIHHP